MDCSEPWRQVIVALTVNLEFKIHQGTLDEKMGMNSSFWAVCFVLALFAFFFFLHWLVLVGVFLSLLYLWYTLVILYKRIWFCSTR